MSKKQIMNQTDAMARAARAKKVTWVGFWVNVVLSVAKIIAGIVGRSGAMIADGVHSISDFVTDIIVIVCYRSLGKRREHPLPLWTRQV